MQNLEFATLRNHITLEFIPVCILICHRLCFYYYETTVTWQASLYATGITANTGA